MEKKEKVRQDFIFSNTTKDVPDYAVVVGNPARVVKMLDAEKFL